MNEPLVLSSVKQWANHAPVVAAYVKKVYTADQVIVHFANREAQLRHKIEQLLCICPKKIKGPDGKIYIWHCPDNLIPQEMP